MNQESMSVFLKINPCFPVVALKLLREVGEIIDPTKVILCRMIKKKRKQLFSEMTEINMTSLHMLPF